MVDKSEGRGKTDGKAPDRLDISTTSLKCGNLCIPDVSQAAGSVIVGVLAFLCFCRSITGDFVFDDNEAILNNQDVRMETSFFSIFKHDFWGANITSAQSHKSYRPLTVLTFRISYLSAGGYNVVGFHLVNILLHTFNSMLALRVFSVIFGGISVTARGSKVFSSPKASFLAAMLFASHPIHAENVAGIVGRADLLCSFFFLASFLSYARNFSSAARKTPSLLPEHVSWPVQISCVVFAALALFSKEQGITVLGICLVYDFLPIFAAKNKAMIRFLKTGTVSEGDKCWLIAFLKRIAFLIFSIMMLLLLRMRIMGGSPPRFQEGDNPSAFAATWYLRAINYNYIYCLNVWLLLNPTWLCFDWSMGCVQTIKTMRDYRIFFVVCFWIGLLLILWKSVKAIETHFGRTILLLLAFAVVPFLPSTNVFFTVGFVIAERNLYISSLGFIGIIVLGAVVLSENRSFVKAAKVSIHIVILVFGLRCFQRSYDWLSEERLFLSGEAVCPLNAKVHYNIGKVLSEKGETETATKYYRESIRLNPFYDQPLNNLGNILQKSGQAIEAEKLLTKAVTISPKFAAGWMNLGVTKAFLKRFKEAEKCYTNAIKHRNIYPDAYYNLGNMYLDMKRYDKAILNYKKVIDMKSDHESSWINLVLLYEEIGKSNLSLSIGREAVRLLPNNAAIMFTVGNLFGKANRYQDAEKYFLRAIALVPNDSTYNGNLAVLYHRWKRYKEAEEYYMRSIKLDPKNKMTVANFNKLRTVLARI